MFDVGFAELFLLAIIGLLVLGPERLPAVARTIGGFMRKARASWICDIGKMDEVREVSKRCQMQPN